MALNMQQKQRVLTTVSPLHINYEIPTITRGLYHYIPSCVRGFPVKCSSAIPQ